MYYAPPKSSIWGHSLRKMPPAIARDRFLRFLKLVAAEHKWTSHHLSVTSASWPYREGDEVTVRERFEELLGVSAPSDGRLWYITEEQFQCCIEEFIRDRDLLIDKQVHISASGYVEISKWLCGEDQIPTRSRLGINYGSSPRIHGMCLYFNTPDAYEHVKRAFADVGLCRLNDKHLKGRGSRKDSRGMSNKPLQRTRKRAAER